MAWSKRATKSRIEIFFLLLFFPFIFNILCARIVTLFRSEDRVAIRSRLRGYVYDNCWHRSLFKIKPVTLRGHGWWGSDKARHMNRKATQIWLVNVATRADKMRLRLADLGVTVCSLCDRVGFLFASKRGRVEDDFFESRTRVQKESFFYLSFSFLYY